ncbi:MAG TPA: type 1 glutamine amidotransferase [Bryobacteraceae bacterium]
MRVAIFRHVSFEGPGRIHDTLAARNIEACIVDDPASAPEADGLIFMGGPMSVNDPLPNLRREEELIRRAVAEQRPVLGICLGSQLIARALGARVYRNPAKEIGWFDIHSTASGASDPVFSALNTRETVFHWHSETFDLPPGAVLLASSELCRHQAFRLGNNVYGFQFHLEVTPEMIADWQCQDANCGDVRELEAPIDPFYNAARLQVCANEMFGRWAELLCTSQFSRT